jgi:signal recognition particle receptor subunit beta
MPHIDRRANEIVMRIVYDGAPEAGKTTNVRQLGEAISLQRRGALASPGTRGRRTEFFDWMDFAGGYLDGRRVRCQVISVPGQPELLRRRRYLLDTADAIIFVADSQRARLAQNARDFALLQRALARREASERIGLLVQANKQDLDDAMPPDELAADLGVEASTPVLPACAHVGEGVMQAFVMAVRQATDRLRELSLSGDLKELPDAASSVEGLHQTLLTLEARDPSPPEASATVAELPQPYLPNVSEVASGSLWPPVRGRESLLSVCRDGIRVATATSAWTAPDACELRTRDGWLFHTSPRWRFAKEVEARTYLLTLVRRLLTIERLLPPGRTLFVGPDGEAWRLWMQTPQVPSLAERMAAARDAGDRERLAAAIQDVDVAARRLDEHELPDALISLDTTAVVDGRALFLGLLDPEPSPKSQLPVRVPREGGLLAEARARFPDLYAAPRAKPSP